MAHQEIAERISSGPEQAEVATYANIAASSWNMTDMRKLATSSTDTDTMGIFGDLHLLDDLAYTEKGYMKVYKPGATAMSDEADKPKEVAKPEAASGTILRGGVIKNQALQANWRETQQHHMLGQEESATDMFYRPGAKKEASQKFELFDSSAHPEPVLLAANVMPNGPKLEQPAQELKNDSQAQQIAQALDGYMVPPTLVPSMEQLGITKESTIAAANVAMRTIKTWTSEHPIAGMEANLMSATTNANPKAWEEAKACFPQLGGVSNSIMKAYVRNELECYGFEDHKQDVAAKLGKDGGWTLGMTQITTEGIRKFENHYPQFRHFLESKGYSGPGHELRALLDADCVAMIVAAKTATLLEDLHKHGIKNPTDAQLAYAYNPDVYSYSDGHGHRVYKALYHPNIELSKAQHWDQRKEYWANTAETISASEHIKNVLRYLP
ncbi:MAG: hypothetical protein J0H83_01145 [Candidatus Melainabacteria bacterium]|nr:hypothetical protein [Candidatus Melainabacteria bacterium]